MTTRVNPGPSKYLAMIVLLCSASANADLLVLHNGDRITGEITRIWDAEITIEPEYTDEFQVDLEAVAYIESSREFEVEFYDGREIDAQLAGANADGEQVFRSTDGSVEAPLEDMLEMLEPEEDFEWDTNIEVAASINRGNTETSNGKIRADSTIKHGDHRHIGDITFFREDLAGVSTKEQDIARYNYNWLFGEAWFFAAGASFERDPIILLDSRVIVSAGIGRDIWNTPRRAMSIQIGAGFQTEESNSVTSDGSVIAWSLRYRQDFFSDDVELFHNQSIVNNITGRSNTSIRTSTGLSYEITDLFSSNISLDYNYETDPIDDLTKSEDIALLLGIVAEF